MGEQIRKPIKFKVNNGKGKKNEYLPIEKIQCQGGQIVHKFKLEYLERRKNQYRVPNQLQSYLECIKV
jgi:hypothetical protein